MEESPRAADVQAEHTTASKDESRDGDIPNPFAANDVIKRLNENEKTREFMKDQGFLEKLEDLSKDSQNLVNHMADHRVMTALAVLLDVDVTIPEIPADRMPNKQSETDQTPMETDDPQSTFDSENKNSFVEPTSFGSPLPRTIPEKMVKCRELKEEGNKLVKAKEWKKAMKKYHHALMYVKGITDKLDSLPGLEAILGRQQPSEQERKDATELMLSLLNNLSLCLLKLKDWEKVVNHTSKILTVRPDDLKALYRRGTAYSQIGKLEAAEEDLKKAQKLDPGDKLIKEQLKNLQRKKAEHVEKEKKMYSAMFST